MHGRRLAVHPLPLLFWAGIFFIMWIILNATKVQRYLGIEEVVVSEFQKSEICAAAFEKEGYDPKGFRRVNIWIKDNPRVLFETMKPTIPLWLFK